MNNPPSMPPHIAKWLQEQLAEIEKAGNELLEAQVYTDADNLPTAVAGTGTIGIAGFYLAADLAAHSDGDLTSLADILARHSVHVEDIAGEEAWPDVLLAALLYMTAQHLEPALAILDSASTPLRLVERDYFAALHPSQGAAGSDDDTAGADGRS